MTPLSRVPWIGPWWDKHAVSVLFFALIAAVAYGFYTHSQAIEDIRELQIGQTTLLTVQSQIQARMVADSIRAVLERDSTAKAHAERDRLAEAARLVRIADARARIIREADVLTCQRSNTTRKVMREVARADVVFWENAHRFALAPTMTLEDFLKLKDQQLTAAKRAVESLRPINCEKAYPVPPDEYH
jgi:hypothetical protein